MQALSLGKAGVREVREWGWAGVAALFNLN